MLLELYAVRGDSMTPSFRPGDRLAAFTAARRPGRLPRGAAVIVLDPRSPRKRYLKRVVGLPGEEVRLSEGQLSIDGGHLPEPYLAGLPASIGLAERSWRVGRDEYFVMGDNRAHSTDSRDFGPVSAEMVISVVWLRWWPPSRWGRAKG